MAAPVRIQLSRRKGWRMPPNTVKVDRSTSFGNPFAIGVVAPYRLRRFHVGIVETAEQSVSLFRRALAADMSRMTPAADRVVDLVASLHGKNLACWCAVNAPCHADVLLEIANRPICEEVA